jgi:hypothetical protein
MEGSFHRTSIHSSTILATHISNDLTVTVRFLRLRHSQSPQESQKHCLLLLLDSTSDKGSFVDTAITDVIVILMSKIDAILQYVTVQYIYLALSTYSTLLLPRMSVHATNGVFTKSMKCHTLVHTKVSLYTEKKKLTVKYVLLLTVNTRTQSWPSKL